MAAATCRVELRGTRTYAWHRDLRECSWWYSEHDAMRTIRTEDVVHNLAWWFWDVTPARSVRFEDELGRWVEVSLSADEGFRCALTRSAYDNGTDERAGLEVSEAEAFAFLTRCVVGGAVIRWSVGP